MDTAVAVANEAERAASTPHRRPAPFLILLLTLGVLFTLLGWFAPASGSWRLVAAAGPLPSTLIGMAACFYAASRLLSRDLNLARAWLLAGIALFCFALAHSIFLLQNQAILLVPVMPALANFARAMQQVLLCAAAMMLLWPRRRSVPRAERLRLAGDIFITTLAVLVLAWIVLLEPITALRLAPRQTVLLLFFPLSQIVLLALTLAIFALGSARPAPSRSDLWLVAGLALATAGGLYQSYVTVHSDPQQFGGSAFFHIWSGLLLAVAALTSLGVDGAGEENETEAREEAPLWRDYLMIALPFAATLGVCATTVGIEYSRGRAGELARWMPVLVLLLAIVTRQLLAMRDNLRLARGIHRANRQLAQSNFDLESHIEARTRHLATLHGITSTLNTSLDRRTVLRVTLEKTMMAVGADSGGIWLRVTRDDPLSSAMPELVPAEATPSGNNVFYWTNVHSHGFDGDTELQTVVRDLAIAAAGESGGAASGAVAAPPASDQAARKKPAPESLILVPIRWQGSLMGMMGLYRRAGQFTPEDRALVESVALEAGTSLQNARLYYDARHRADRDSVTSLLNHRAVQESLNRLLRQARGDGGVFSIVMMDLNNFKFFNDTYGHPVGDDVLRTVAQCLRAVCRSEDLLGRYGGDEFIALLPETDADGARSVCRRIASALDQHHFEAEPGSRIPISMAFGWAAYPDDGESALEMLARADTNLYDNKRSGGAVPELRKVEVTAGVRDEMRRLSSRASGGSFGVLDALVTAIDNKDQYTRRHSEEVTHMALLIARELNYSEEAMRAVRISGLLHDVGKIAVPDDVLRHPGRLSDEQWNIMKQHPVFGALIVKDLPHLDEVLGGVRHHHERWDGKGYPDGLAEEAIPPLGRLLAVPDCYSAMTTDRPYRKGFTPQAALAEIEKSSGTQFDPNIAGAFLRVMRRELLAEAEDGRNPLPYEEVDPAKLPARAV